jgi:hypothetical protein
MLATRTLETPTTLTRTADFHDIQLHYFSAVLLSCCPAVLLSCCPAVLLSCCPAVLLFSVRYPLTGVHSVCYHVHHLRDEAPVFLFSYVIPTPLGLNTPSSSTKHGALRAVCCVLSRTWSALSQRLLCRPARPLDPPPGPTDPSCVHCIGAMSDPLKLTQRRCGVDTAWSSRTGMAMGQLPERRGWHAASIRAYEHTSIRAYEHTTTYVAWRGGRLDCG